MVNAEASIRPLCRHFALCKDLADKKMEYRLVARDKLMSDTMEVKQRAMLEEEWPWKDGRGEEQLKICADDDQGRGRKAPED